MAEQLDDGEFWLPSQFLTDDDDFSTSDPGSFSTDTENSDFNDLLDFPVLSTFHRSSLIGYERNYHGSPAAPVKQSGDNINEMANMKIVSPPRTNIGTGFFDCSNVAKNNGRRLSFPPPQPNTNTTRLLPSVYSPPRLPLFGPNTTRGSGQLPTPQQQQQPQNRVTKNNSNNRPMGLPLAAWPALSGQAQPQHQAQPMIGTFVGPKRESAGTGVFLPRRIASPAQSKKKPEGNATKTKSNKSSTRQNTGPCNMNEDEIQLPSEWDY